MTWLTKKGSKGNWNKNIAYSYEKDHFPNSQVFTNFIHLSLIAQLLHLFAQLIVTKPFCYLFSMPFLFLFVFQIFIFLSQPHSNQPFLPNLNTTNHFIVNSPKLSKERVKIQTTIHVWMFKKKVQNPI